MHRLMFIVLLIRFFTRILSKIFRGRALKHYGLSETMMFSISDGGHRILSGLSLRISPTTSQKVITMVLTSMSGAANSLIKTLMVRVNLKLSSIGISGCAGDGLGIIPT